MMPGRSYTPATIRWIVRNRKWLLVGPMLFFGAGALAVTYMMKDEYRAQTLILVVPQRVPEKYVGAAIAETIEQRLQSIQPQILSESRLERIITELDLYPNKRGKRGGMEEIVADMRGDIGVEIMRGDLFRVTVHRQQPVQGDAGHAAPGVAVCRRKPQGSRTAGDGHKPVPRVPAGQYATRARRTRTESPGVPGRRMPGNYRPRSAPTSRFCRPHRSSSRPARKRSATIGIGGWSSNARWPN